MLRNRAFFDLHLAVSTKAVQVQQAVSSNEMPLLPIVNKESFFVLSDLEWEASLCSEAGVAEIGPPGG